MGEKIKKKRLPGAGSSGIIDNSTHSTFYVTGSFSGIPTFPSMSFVFGVCPESQYLNKYCFDKKSAKEFPTRDVLFFVLE